MKLRNKKTGEIVRVEFLSNWQTDDGTEIGFRECNTNIVYSYNTLAELNADWEDYTPQEPQEEIGKQLVSSLYDKDFYWADEKQQEAFREFCREEDKRPENQKIPSDLYGDSARFGGVLSGNDRPRNMSEFNAWRNGDDFLFLREVNEQLGRERWQHFVETFGLEKFSKSKEPLIKDEKIRKAVRAWAYINSVKSVIYTHNKSKNLFIITDSDECYFIHFVGWIPELQDGCSYAITELCGEEEDA